MSVRSTRNSRPVERRGWIFVFATIELLALGAAAFLPLLLVVPQWLGIETWCLLDESTQTADAFAVAVAAGIVGTGLIVLALMAYVILGTDRGTRGWWLIPPAWLGVLVAAEAIARLFIGPQPCSGIDFF